MTNQHDYKDKRSEKSLCETALTTKFSKNIFKKKE